MENRRCAQNRTAGVGGLILVDALIDAPGPESTWVLVQRAGRGDAQATDELFDRYVPLIRYEFQPKIGLAYRKFVYHRRGIIDSPFIRPPGLLIDDYTRAELTAIIERVGLSLDVGVVQPDEVASA